MQFASYPIIGTTTTKPQRNERNPGLPVVPAFRASAHGFLFQGTDIGMEDTFGFGTDVSDELVCETNRKVPFLLATFIL